MRKCILVAVVFMFVFCNVAAFAQTASDEADAKLRDIINKKTQVINLYDVNTQNVKKAADEKIEGFRKQFHKDRDACLAERNAKLEELKREYDEEIRPLVAEEKQLIESMGGGAAMNFAKKKSKI